MITPQRRDLAVRVLMKAAAADNRRLGTDEERQMAVAFWAETLHPDTTLEDAMRAVSEHYATNETWLMPAHVNRLTAKYRRARLEPVIAPWPPGLADEPHLEAAWRTHWHRVIQAGGGTESATSLAWQHIGRTPPKELTASASGVDVPAALARFKNQFGRKKDS